MKQACRILFVIATALIAYGYWGAFTQAGNKRYDEMDGFIPFILLLTGLVLLIISIILFVILRRRQKNN